MLFFGLVSPDQALCETIGEQLKRAPVWQLAVFPSMVAALDVWQERLPAVLLWDVESDNASPATQAQLTDLIAACDDPPHLIVLGDDKSLQLDASDSFVRPLRLGVLLARLQFYQKVAQQTPDQAVPLGPWFFNPRRRTLAPASGGQALRLTDKESSLLAALYAAPGGITRDKLLEDVWGYNSQADTHTIETHIYRLRRKMDALAPEGGEAILAENGRYLLAPSWRGA